MKILSLDTSSNICSVAILEDTNIVAQKCIENELTHSQKLMPLVDEILTQTKLTLKDFDFYACCTGPGSFTGVRIGVSTVKAFCDVTNVPVVGVSSLESLAYNTLNFANNTDIVCAVLDAKNDNVYFGLFKKIESHFELLENLDAKNIDEMIATLEKYFNTPILFVGDGSKKHQCKLQEHFSRSIFTPDLYDKQTAISVGISGYYHYANGEAGTSNSIVPLYLRKSQAERALEGEK